MTSRSLSVLAFVSLASAGAEDGRALRRQGHLVEAAHAYEVAGSPLEAAECFLRAGLPGDAIRCLRLVDADVPKAWVSWLGGVPVSLRHLSPDRRCPAAEAHLAGLLCGLLGDVRREREWLRLAYDADADHPVYGADLCRALDSDSERQVLLAALPPGSETALVKAEDAVRRGDAAHALAALKEAGPVARANSLRQLCGEKGDPEPADESAYNSEVTSAPMAMARRLDRNGANAKAAGLTLEEYETRQWQSFFDGWQRRADEIIQAHRGQPAALRILRRRAAFLAFATHYGTFAGHEAEARAGLGDFIAVIVADPQQPDLARSLRALSMLWANLGAEPVFAEMCCGLRRQMVSKPGRARAQYEAAHYQRAVRHRPGDAEGPLAELLETRGWEGSDHLNEQMVRTELLWARWEKERRPLPVASVRLLEGGERPLRAKAGQFLLLEFFDVECAFCAEAARKLKEWQQLPQLSGLEILAVGVNQNGSQKKEHAAAPFVEWPVVDDPAAEATLTEALGCEGTPSFCVVDAEGRVLALAAGLYDLPYIRGVMESGTERAGR